MCCPSLRIVSICPEKEATHSVRAALPHPKQSTLIHLLSTIPIVWAASSTKAAHQACAVTTSSVSADHTIRRENVNKHGRTEQQKLCQSDIIDIPLRRQCASVQQQFGSAKQASARPCGGRSRAHRKQVRRPCNGIRADGDARRMRLSREPVIRGTRGQLSHVQSRAITIVALDRGRRSLQHAW